MELPQFINEFNKKKKSTKITTLGKASAFKLKRFFSGSFATDFITGGGFAYRRIQLLYGSKSSGKNALLNQTTAYLQRQCRTCNGILPEYIDEHGQAKDSWTFMLRDILGYSVCTCQTPQPKRVFILDYERALAIEEPRDVKTRLVKNKETGEEIDELDYNDALMRLQAFSAKAKLTDKDKEKIKKDEEFLKSIVISEKFIQKLATKDYLLKCGVNPDKLLVADPEDTEEGIEMVKEAVRSKEVDAIIWDSLQAAIPRYVMNRDADQATMGIEAKQNGLLMRQVCSSFAAGDLTDATEAYKPALFITSQVRSNLSGFISGPDTYSGGNAVQHHISLALEVKRSKFLQHDGSDAEFKDQFFGQRVRLRADKNKLSSPGDMYEYDYYFKEGPIYPIGIDSIGELLNVANKLDLLEHAGTWYVVNGEKIQGLKNLKKLYKENYLLVRELYLKLMGTL